MSIDARIDSVTVLSDGTVRLGLRPREGQTRPAQDALVVVNPPYPPELLEACIGTKIWGGAGDIMIGETRWATRLSYTRIQLVVKKGPPYELPARSG